MRRLFHGRMITVGGHMRRMEVDYNFYSINTSTMQAFAITNKNPNTSTITSQLMYAVSTQNLGKKITINLTKTNYQFEAWAGDAATAEKIVSWTSTPTTITIDTDAKMRIVYVIGKGTAHTASIKPGECGIIITEE